jgi:dihydropteroate synthase
MGVLNVTPDSFSDGGAFLDHAAAITQARALIAAGADIIDIGGESTRPGADPVSVDEECARVVPVIEALVALGGPPVSVDTMKAPVAQAALAAGARIVNDVSAGGFDPEMLAVVAAAGAGYVAMHMQGEPRTMQDAPAYDDVVVEVGARLRSRVDAAIRAGIDRDAICADPGIGFGKTTAHNVELLQHLPRLREIAGIPLLVGTSRKRFLGTLARPSAPLDVTERAEATTASVVWCFAHGVAVVRVHDVAAAVAARRTWMRAQLQQSGKR